MSSTPIFFHFDTQDSASLAQDTLEELGYRVSPHTEAAQPTLHVIVDRHDLASALEIVQAYGGRLVQYENSPAESDVYAMAYNHDEMIPIPAHTVNEDWADEDAELSASDYVNKSSGAYNDENIPFDPSGEDYNGFDAGVHM